MKRTTVITLAVLVAFAGSAHAIRPNPGTPAILDEIEIQLRGMEQKIQALQAETSTLRFENRRLRTQVSNLIAINERVGKVHLAPLVRPVSPGASASRIGYGLHRRDPAPSHVRGNHS